VKGPVLKKVEENEEAGREIQGGGEIWIHSVDTLLVFNGESLVVK
jgi:hypothetical protein